MDEERTDKVRKNMGLLETSTGTRRAGTHVSLLAVCCAACCVCSSVTLPHPLLSNGTVLSKSKNMNMAGYPNQDYQDVIVSNTCAQWLLINLVIMWVSTTAPLSWR